MAMDRENGLRAPQNAWQRHDWQSTPFSPQLRIVQALVKGGKTASGAGFSRYDAFSRCLGETAEIIALAKGEHSEGVAAGPDFAFASQQALAERLERWAIWEWWHGNMEAHPISAPALIEQLRKGAQTPRQTTLWHLPEFAPLRVSIALSISKEGDRPILGFGASICPQASAQSALIELGLMELNLMAPVEGLSAYFERILKAMETHFTIKNPKPVALVEDTIASDPQALEERLTELGIGFQLQNLTTPETGLSVARAHLPKAPSWKNNEDFLNGPLI